MHQEPCSTFCLLEGLVPRSSEIEERAANEGTAAGGGGVDDDAGAGIGATGLASFFGVFLAAVLVGVPFLVGVLARGFGGVLVFSPLSDPSSLFLLRAGEESPALSNFAAALDGVFFAGLLRP